MPASSLSRRSVEVEAGGAGGGRAKSRAPCRKRRSEAYQPASFPVSSCTATRCCSEGAADEEGRHKHRPHPPESHEAKGLSRGRVSVSVLIESLGHRGLRSVGCRCNRRRSGASPGSPSKVPIDCRTGTGTLASSCRGGRAMNSDVDVVSR